MTDNVTMIALSASLQYKTSVAMDFVCQITLNQKLLHKLEKWRIFKLFNQIMQKEIT
jgi:hypothetical protein